MKEKRKIGEVGFIDDEFMSRIKEESESDIDQIRAEREKEREDEEGF